MSTIPSYPVSTIAKLLDLTERRVQQLAIEGVIPKSTQRKYELVPSVQGYVKYLRERSLGKDIGTNSTSLERARLIRIQADKLEQDMKLRDRTLLESDEVKAGWISMLTHCRTLLLSIPNRLAYQLASISSPQETAKLLKQTIHEALEELSSCDGTIDLERENYNNLITNSEEKYNNEDNNINWQDDKENCRDNQKDKKHLLSIKGE